MVVGTAHVSYSSPIIFIKLYLIIGQTGLGKSTLVNTLFASHLIDSKGRQAVDDMEKQTTRIEAVSHGKKQFFNTLKAFCCQGLTLFSSY